MNTTAKTEACKEIQWDRIIGLYNTIKYIYALCEETDDQLSTNLQPLNEFRAALDHLMRIVAIEKLNTYKGKDPLLEAEKLHSHLRRAFFDVCDLLSINYRNKIIKKLKRYSPECIEKALPDYYSVMRPRLEEMTEIIASLRTDKRIASSYGQDAIDAYTKIIEELKQYHKTVLSAVPSLNEIRAKTFMVKWGFPILVFLVGTALTIIGLIR